MKSLLEKYLPDYRVNKWIFRIVFLIVFGLLFSIIAYSRLSHGEWFHNYVYLECYSERGCLNPYYETCKLQDCEGVPLELQTMEYLPRGVSGDKPPLLIEWYSLICVCLFGIGLLLNHFLYNKHYFSFKDLKKIE